MPSCIKISDNQLTIRLTTKSKLNVLLKDGDVTVYEEKKFYRAVRAFYQTAVQYALDHLPLDDDVIQNSQFVDIVKRLDSDINQVLFFCQRYLFLLIGQFLAHMFSFF